MLVHCGLVNEEVLVRALSKLTGIPRADLSAGPDAAALSRVSRELAEQCQLVPVVLRDDGRLVVAANDPQSAADLLRVREEAGCEVSLQFANATDIRAARDRWYSTNGLEAQLRECEARGTAPQEEGTVARQERPRDNRRMEPPARPSPCDHPSSRLGRVAATCGYVDADGIECTACGRLLELHFFPDNDNATVPPVVLDSAWRGGPDGFGWDDARARTLPSRTLPWEAVAGHVPPQGSWSWLE